MTLTLSMVTFDTTDALALSHWWAEQTGAEVLEENDGWFVLIRLPSGQRVSFQKVDDPTPGKNRIHLDLETDDLKAETARLIEAGAELLDTQTMGDFSWHVFADPQGNQFCVASQH